ncbi:hypothetical protein [Nocardiopsis synnemataformans]|uniref:hypothetical protein n=1 Tax=Nocardiopsis synnemataformans TaxID=61305 RepID=UPI003EBE1674
MPPGSGPCQTWPLDPSCLCKGWSPNPGEWTAEQMRSVEMATELLWRLTAGTFGVCPQIVRPCRRSCPQPRHGGGMQPAVIDGVWVNLSGCGCGCVTRCDDCDCGRGPDRITIPGPIYAPITATGAADPGHPVRVWVDGHQLTPDQYWIQAPNQVVRTDGGRWPQCQDMSVPHDAPGAFAISYWRGNPVPPGGRRAVAKLACELDKACRGDDCELPDRVTEVAREGISYTILDPQEHLDRGRTGLREVDLWLSTVNPNNLRSRPKVWSPDLPKVRREGIRPWA